VLPYTLVRDLSPTRSARSQFPLAPLGLLFACLCLSAATFRASAQAPGEGLAGTSWQLIRIQTGSGQIIRPDEASSFRVEFRTDSTVAVQLDCHRGRGTWVSRATSQLELGPLALGRATCPQTALHDQVLEHWPLIRSYEMRDRHLFLSARAGGGTYEFEAADLAAARAAARAASEPVATTSQPHGPSERVPASQLVTTLPPGAASWLDTARQAPWNTPGASIPSAPKIEGARDPRCRVLARPPELDTDKRLTDLGWDLIGAYQGGWGMLVVEAAAGYDGMCRPRAYQGFVFLRGVFVGTLSPGTMDSRTDGALNRVTLQDGGRLIAEYARYGNTDPLCCPSRTTSVVFEIAPDQPVVRPVSVSSSANR
jgi:hypothetical protein